MSKMNNKGKGCVAVILALGLIRKANRKRKQGRYIHLNLVKEKQISYSPRTTFG
jgi:hypothetical protein